MATIPKGSTVLVTGVNGFIASHVADQFLEAGYLVRGTVRSRSKAEPLFELFDKKYGKGKFEVVEVEHLAAEGAFDEAVKGVSGICHLASIVTFSDNPEEVIPDTIKGTLNVLTSATKEPGVKSVVYTSSSTAALLPQPNKKIVVTTETWDDAAVDAAWSKEKKPDAFTVYGASKTEAERAFWKAIEQSKPPFQASAVLPNCNMGTVLTGKPTSTAAWVDSMYKGDDSPFQFPPQWYVNVRDDARVHVAALIDPAANGQRLFAFAGTYTWNQVLAIFRKLEPNKTFLEDRDEGEDLSEIPNQAAEELLKKHYGHGWTSLEDSVKESLVTSSA